MVTQSDSTTAYYDKTGYLNYYLYRNAKSVNIFGVQIFPDAALLVKFIEQILPIVELSHEKYIFYKNQKWRLPLSTCLISWFEPYLLCFKKKRAKNM